MVVIKGKSHCAEQRLESESVICQALGECVGHVLCKALASTAVQMNSTREAASINIPSAVGTKPSCF